MKDRNEAEPFSRSSLIILISNVVAICCLSAIIFFRPFHNLAHTCITGSSRSCGGGFPLHLLHSAIRVSFSTPGTSGVLKIRSS